MKKRGFTLIELLAVIIILAIIALIAVPIVINLIEKSRRSAFEDSVYGVVKAGELYYAESVMDDEGFNGETFDFETSSHVAKLNLKGSAPTKGWMNIDVNGNISLSVTNGKYTADKGKNESKLTITDGDNVKDNSSSGPTLSSLARTSTELEVTSINGCATSGICAPGTPFAIEVKTGAIYKFYVLSDNGTKVNLIMSENLGSTVAWGPIDYGDAILPGPTYALEALANRTSDWENISTYSYTLKNEVDNFGGEWTYEDIEVTDVKARMITYTELVDAGCEFMGSTPDWLAGSYWSSTLYSGGGDAWHVNNFLYNFVNSGIGNEWDIGLRPVIELSK